MNDDRYVAAIEISSSKIMGAVGVMHPDGRLNIIATAGEKGVESVRYGILQNLEETSMRITRVIDRLQNRPSVAPLEITSLFVGLSGRSMRGICTEVEIILPEGTEITEDILTQLKQKALGTAIDSSLEVIDAIPRTYTVGKTVTLSPKGMVGNKIQAVFDLVICRPELKRNLARTLEDKIGIDIKGFVVTALATAQVILTTEEKRLGCMLVDMGAETTTVSIYKEGSLRYFATLPLGGRNITRDITSLSGVLEERAEDIKITSGNAMARETASHLVINNVRMVDVNNLIVARSEEIVANIVEQLKYAGLKDSDLSAGIIVIGGGARLSGLTELLGRQADMSVRRGQLPAYIHLEDTKTPASDLLQTASVLYSGAVESEGACLEEPEPEQVPITGEGNEEGAETATGTNGTKGGNKGTNGGIWEKLSNKIAGMFSAPKEDDSDLL